MFRLCSTQGFGAFDIPTFFAAAVRVVIRCARKLCKLMNSRPVATRVVSPMKKQKEKKWVYISESNEIAGQKTPHGLARSLL